MDNLYQTPTADLDLPTSQEGDAFFVTSPLKLAVLYVVTFGWYSLYWFYKHWKTLQPRLDEEITPWARALFYWFFTHALFNHIAEKQKSAGMQPWNYSGMATLIILADLLSRFFERMSDRIDIENGGSTTLLTGMVAGSVVFLLLPLWPMLAAQHRANALAGDATGSSNSHFSVANIFFTLIGITAWGFLGWAVFLS